MARTTGVSRQTIRKIVRGQRHDIFRTRQSSLDPWRVRLEAEWTGGCRNGAELWRRLQASGFAGSLRVVGEWATRRRRDDRLGQTAGPSLSARTIARGLTAERAAGSARIALVNATIETAAPDLIAARDLLDRFHAMMRSKDEAGLVPWIASAKHSKLRKLRRRHRGGPGRRGRRHRRAVVEWSGRRKGQPPQTHQAPDVRPRQPRPAQSPTDGGTVT